MRKRTKISGFNSVMLLIVSVLALVLIFGAVAVLFKPIANEEIDGLDEPPSTEQEVLPPMPVGAFGGKTIFSESFDSTDATVTTGLQTLNSQQYSLNYEAEEITASFEEALRFEYTGTDVADSQILAALVLADEGNTVYFHDVGYCTFDFDISLEGMSNRVTFLNYYRKETSSACASQGDYHRIYAQNKDGMVGFYVDSDNDKEMELVKRIPSTTFHITFVYKHDFDNPYFSEGQVYVNGEYICDIPRVVGPTAFRIANFRISVLPSDNLVNEGILSIDNININIFEAGYEGAIEWLFLDEDIKLQDCSDSVLFEGEYPEEDTSDDTAGEISAA